MQTTKGKQQKANNKRLKNPNIENKTNKKRTDNN